MPVPFTLVYDFYIYEFEFSQDTSEHFYYLALATTKEETIKATKYVVGGIIFCVIATRIIIICKYVIRYTQGGGNAL